MAECTANKINEQLRLIKHAYPEHVEIYEKGMTEEMYFPLEFCNSQRFVEFFNLRNVCNYEATKIRTFLQPGTKDRFLDIGCCLNLIGYKLYKWPSQYFGVDISPRMVQVLNRFVREENLSIGGLAVAPCDQLPFPAEYFRIAAAFGILEYYDMEGIRKALAEIHRILQPKGRLVLDMPNPHHSYARTMFEYEEYLGQQRRQIPSRRDFESELKKLFHLKEIDDSGLMIQYFVTKE